MKLADDESRTEKSLSGISNYRQYQVKFRAAARGNVAETPAVLNSQASTASSQHFEFLFEI